MVPAVARYPVRRLRECGPSPPRRALRPTPPVGGHASCPALLHASAAGSVARLPEAAPTTQSQRDGGSHGAGARQPSPGRCHVQLRRRGRLSGAGHADGHAVGARAAPATPRGTCTEGVGVEERRGISRCRAELTLGCKPARFGDQGSG